MFIVVLNIVLSNIGKQEHSLDPKRLVCFLVYLFFGVCLGLFLIAYFHFVWLFDFCLIVVILKFFKKFLKKFF